MIKILGVADIISSLILIIIAIGIEVPWILIFGAGAYLLLKVLLFIFSFDFASAIDSLGCVCLMLSLFFSLPSLILYIAAALLLQKGFFSLL